MDYAEQARRLSTQFNDSPGFEEAQVRIAEILGDNRKFEDADKLLPIVHDTAKVNMQLVLSHKNYNISDDATDKYFRKALQFS